MSDVQNMTGFAAGVRSAISILAASVVLWYCYRIAMGEFTLL